MKPIISYGHNTVVQYNLKFLKYSFNILFLFHYILLFKTLSSFQETGYYVDPGWTGIYRNLAPVPLSVGEENARGWVRRSVMWWGGDGGVKITKIYYITVRKNHLKKRKVTHGTAEERNRFSIQEHQVLYNLISHQENSREYNCHSNYF